MARSKHTGRPVDGILLLDKPAGITSNRALQRVRRLFDAAKAGHTGSLDPFATGMLPVCLGQATKVSGFLLESYKEYAVSLEFGTATDTADLEGRVIDVRATQPIPQDRVEEVLQAMVGHGRQIPPMYSALKHEGKRLYRLARAGIEVERKPRPVHIEWIRFAGLEWPRLDFTVRCSKALSSPVNRKASAWALSLVQQSIRMFQPDRCSTADCLNSVSAESGSFSRMR